MLLKWHDIYSNADVLSPIDKKTWHVVGEMAQLDKNSKVIELASGKGALALYLAEKFGSNVDAYEINSAFVKSAMEKSQNHGLQLRVAFIKTDVNTLEVENQSYDLGACLGALYIFREAGWKILTKGVKTDGYLAISELYAKKLPVPRTIMSVFFEGSDSSPWTLDDARRWYWDRGMTILKEEECSRRAWLAYYDLTRERLMELQGQYRSDRERLVEIEEALREDRLFRKYGEEYLGYMTFIMKTKRSG